MREKGTILICKKCQKGIIITLKNPSNLNLVCLTCKKNDNTDENINVNINVEDFIKSGNEISVPGGFTFEKKELGVTELQKQFEVCDKCKSKNKNKKIYYCYKCKKHLCKNCSLDHDKNHQKEIIDLDECIKDIPEEDNIEKKIKTWEEYINGNGNELDKAKNSFIEALEKQKESIKTSFENYKNETKNVIEFIRVLFNNNRPFFKNDLFCCKNYFLIHNMLNYFELRRVPDLLYNKKDDKKFDFTHFGNEVKKINDIFSKTVINNKKIEKKEEKRKYLETPEISKKIEENLFHDKICYSLLYMNDILITLGKGGVKCFKIEGGSLKDLGKKWEDEKNHSFFGCRSLEDNKFLTFYNDKNVITEYELLKEGLSKGKEVFLQRKATISIVIPYKKEGSLLPFLGKKRYITSSYKDNKIIIFHKKFDKEKELCTEEDNSYFTTSMLFIKDKKILVVAYTNRTIKYYDMEAKESKPEIIKNVSSYLNSMTYLNNWLFVGGVNSITVIQILDKKLEFKKKKDMQFSISSICPISPGYLILGDTNRQMFIFNQINFSEKKIQERKNTMVVRSIVKIKDENDDDDDLFSFSFVSCDDSGDVIVFKTENVTERKEGEEKSLKKNNSERVPKKNNSFKDNK